ncbi:penicillin-binding transpeptidase domain-containing protein [Porphyromonas macacae]|uniref:penicillin-binding transpeptidase domain-containing protein n=1 Tax=Porphyromonas macacae TaxID=28115 RepID=UPI000E0E9815|nr:penicillin-binding transpeptidase domain-containing protein [Porphyromonas macacae]
MDAGSGTCVLMEVETGKNLAISNLGKTAREICRNIELCLQDMSEPGSTFKTASMMVAWMTVWFIPTILSTWERLMQVAGRTVRDHNRPPWRIRQDYGRTDDSLLQQRRCSKNHTAALCTQAGRLCAKNRNLGFGLDLKLEIEGYEKALIRKRSDNPNRWYGTTLPWMSYGYETQYRRFIRCLL